MTNSTSGGVGRTVGSVCGRHKVAPIFWRDVTLSVSDISAQELNGSDATCKFLLKDPRVALKALVAKISMSVKVNDTRVRTRTNVCRLEVRTFT